MLSVAVDVWIGNAAAVLSGGWGAVSCGRPGALRSICPRPNRRSSATGCAMGLSLGQLTTLLAIFLPHGAVPSRATVGGLALVGVLGPIGGTLISNDSALVALGNASATAHVIGTGSRLTSVPRPDTSLPS